MAENSKIEWTDATFTPIRARNLKTGKIGWHCEHATTGCEFCYAEGMNKRLGTGLPFKPGHRKDIEIVLDEEMLLAPLRWKKPRMIFVCSMTDLFADFVQDEWIDRVFAVMALSPQHTFQVLTKRAERMRAYCSDPKRPAAIWRAINEYDDAEIRLPRLDGSATLAALRAHGATWGGEEPWPFKNIWLGISAERQQEWDERKEHLRNTPAAVHFASFEPLLGAIVEPRPMSDFIQWAIVGGESGPNARPMHPNWALHLRDQCRVWDVPFFFKQRGEYTWIDDADYDADEIPELPRNWRERSDDKYICMRADGSRASGYGGDSAEFFYRVGKAKAGRLLDGKEHNGFPQ